MQPQPVTQSVAAPRRVLTAVLDRPELPERPELLEHSKTARCRPDVRSRGRSARSRSGGPRSRALAHAQRSAQRA